MVRAAGLILEGSRAALTESPHPFGHGGPGDPKQACNLRLGPADLNLADQLGACPGVSRALRGVMRGLLATLFVSSHQQQQKGPSLVNNVYGNNT